MESGNCDFLGLRWSLSVAVLYPSLFTHLSGSTDFATQFLIEHVAGSPRAKNRCRGYGHVLGVINGAHPLTSANMYLRLSCVGSGCGERTRFDWSMG